MRKRDSVRVIRRFHIDNDFATIMNLNPLKGTLKLHSNQPLCRNTVIGTLAVDGWAVTFGTARRGLGGLGPRPVLSLLYQM